MGVATAFFVIGKYKEKVDRLQEDVGKISDNVQAIRDKVISCETSLKEREPLTRRRSPVTLTDRGTKILIESTGKTFVDTNFSDLYARVEAMTPKSAYDVQEFSKLVIEQLKDDDKFKPFKDYAFKEGLEIEDIIVVLGICLRDKVLIAKQWNVEDIDQHDPAVKT